ncbi:MAG: type II toxin-antitoxin system HicB family antitoxin [Candidatus Jettenia caeni]|nr:MAG: type II toxin-antitoxin system HicB family antitoxin [Candidatus Jettenia caeni]
MDSTNTLKIQKKLTLIYWKEKNFWLGKLLEYPEIMTQGKTIKELVENIKDAYSIIVLDDVPNNYQTKEIIV